MSVEELQTKIVDEGLFTGVESALDILFAKLKKETGASDVDIGNAIKLETANCLENFIEEARYANK